MQENGQPQDDNRGVDDAVEAFVNDFVRRSIPEQPDPPFDMRNRPDIKPFYTVMPILRASLFPASDVQKCASQMSLSPDELKEIARYQVARASQALREQMNVPMGLADRRVRVIVVNPAAFDYPRALMREMSRDLCIGDSKQGLVIVKSNVSRMWQLDANGFSLCTVPDNIEELYRENRKWAEENYAFFHGKSVQHPIDGVLEEKHDPGSPILVILGILPIMDPLDYGLFENEALMSSYLAPAKRNAYRQKHIPPQDYRSAYSKYLNDRSRASISAPQPLSPGDFNLRLNERERLRSQRLRCLQVYTGIHRMKAVESDVLAGSQAFLFRIFELLLEKSTMGFMSLAIDPMMLAHPEMAKLRERMLIVSDRIVVDEIVSPALAVCSLTKNAQKGMQNCEVLYQELPDTEMGGALLERYPELPAIHQYTTLSPRKSSDFLLRPAKTSSEYSTWRALTELSAIPAIGGLMEKRQGALIDIDKDRLEERMKAYFNPDTAWESLKALKMGLTEPQSRFDPEAVRRELLHSTGFSARSIKRYTFKPFDDRWCYHSTARSLWGEPKPTLAALAEGDNQFLVMRSGKVIADEGVPFFFTTLPGDTDVLRGHSYYIPLWFQQDSQTRLANLSQWTSDYLAALGVLPDASPIDAAKMVWNHVLAIAFSPAYLLENREGIGQGWPRVPFPGGCYSDAAANKRASEIFEKSAALGEKIVALLHLSDEVEGVTCGAVGSGLLNMAVCNGMGDGHAAIPVTVGWGKRSREGAVLPSHGRLGAREYSAEEKRCLEREAWNAGVHAGGAYLCLGNDTFDIHLNGTVSIQNIPAKVWKFTIGGYPVLKKWLSYRDESVLGRPLIRSEVDSFCQIARRIATVLLMGPRLNRNYAVIRDLHTDQKAVEIEHERH